MRLALLSCSLLALLAACGGSAPVGPDATVFCQKVAYDPCTTEHDCANMLCQTFEVSPRLQVCTQLCSGPTDPPCPDENGVAVPCGSAGLCEPAAATMCELNP